MPDDNFEDSIRPLIDERLRRTRKAKRELQQFMNPLAIPWIAVAGLALILAFPVGVALLSAWIGVQVTIAFLDIYPYTIFSTRAILLALLALVVPIALMLLRLGQIVDLLAAFWITAWTILIALEIHKAILRRRQE